MNLFDMFLRDSGSNEAVFSSVLTYLLDRCESHGLGPLILDRVIAALPNEDARSLLSQPGLEVQTTEADSRLGELGQTPPMIALSPQDASKSVFLYLVPDSDSVTALREFSSCIRDKSFVMYWRDTQQPDTTLPAANVCSQTFESVLRDVLQDDMTGRIPPVSTEMRWVLKSLIYTIHNNFTREPDVYGRDRFPDRSAFLGNLPTVHRLLFEYLEEKSGSRRSVSPRNTSISFPGTGTDTLFRVLTMKNFRQTATEIIETDYADTLIMELDETTWALDDTMKDTLAALFKGTAHVAFHQYHPNGRNDQEATWILFGEGIDTESLPQVKTQIDKFRVLAEERFRAFQKSP